MKHLSYICLKVLQNVSKSGSYSFISTTNVKQECIPLGCVLTTAVAVTRCQHLGALPTGGSLPTGGKGVCLLGGSAYWGNGSAWMETPPVDRQTLLKILPSLYGREQTSASIISSEKPSIDASSVTTWTTVVSFMSFTHTCYANKFFQSTFAF